MKVEKYFCEMYEMALLLLVTLFGQFLSYKSHINRTVIFWYFISKKGINPLRSIPPQPKPSEVNSEIVKKPLLCLILEPLKRLL